ncbi:MAG TPA: ATP-binding protein [Kofleriaceae bacterium]|nr:ATP-binding protein [Kofleriaceae bacterium]
MKLRGRFTVTLALAALVPITIAAVVTTRVIAAKLREDYHARREQAQRTVETSLETMQAQVAQAAGSLATRDHPFVGTLLTDVAQGSGAPLPEAQHWLDEQAGPTMRGLALDILTITGPDDVVLVSPHYHGQIGDPNAVAIVRKRAEATSGAPYFSRDTIRTPHTVETVLVVESARLAHDAETGYTVALWAGRRVTDALLESVYGKTVDARIVMASGELVLPPKHGDAEWARVKDPIRVPMLGPDHKPVAYVEVAVSDGELDQIVRSLTLTSALLALGALAGVVLVGMLVARRTVRDLDVLVEGSLAAARGELDYRVPVRDNDEVGAVASAFNFMMEDLKTSKEKLVIAERIAAWQDIARRLAHEIKNPLTPIQMAMDTLRKSYKKQHPDFAEILDESTATVLEEADRLKRIVAEFSDFARMPKPELGRADLNEIVSASLALYKGGTPPVELRLADHLPRIDADKGQINQVLLNLVENARDALGGRDDGKVTVTTKRGDANDRVLLVVDDNGPGVPPGAKDKVFAPYFTTKQTKGGTGLGLAIVHRIVSDHGGRITIGDAPGGGARFMIELPLRDGTALLASRV